MTAMPKKENLTPLGGLKLKYVALFLILTVGWAGLYAPEAISFLLTLNLFGLIFLNLVRFRFLPKVTRARGLSIVKAAPKDASKARAVLVCQNESPKKALRTLKSLRAQTYPNLETVIIKVGEYDDTYAALKEFCDDSNGAIKLFRREGPMNHGEAISACLDHGPQDYKAALILSSGLKVDAHVLNEAMHSLDKRQADYLQFFTYSKTPSFKERKKQRFFQTYMRAASSCASPGIIAPMTLIKKDSIPRPRSWMSEKNPFLSLSIALIKNGKRGFFETGPCGTGAKTTVMNLKDAIFEVKLGDALQIGAPRFVPLLLQLTSYFHFLTIPALYFALSGLDMRYDLGALEHNSHSAFLAGSAVLLSLYFKLALSYQKHFDDISLKELLKNYLLDLGSLFQGRGLISRAALSIFLLGAMAHGALLYHSSANIAYLSIVFAAGLAICGALMAFKDASAFYKRRIRPSKSPSTPRRNKSVWRVEVNSSEA